jgi:hypothetical protein
MRRKAPFRPKDPPRKHPCLLCGKTANHWHHLITRQRLRRYVDRQGLLPVEAFALELRLVNDQRNLVALCVHCHLDRRGGLEAEIPGELLPEGAWEFADEIDMEHVMLRRYGPSAARHGS